MLEAAGNMAYLLPLMVTFGSSRYVGNAINLGMYDMQIMVKDIPILEGSLHSLGLLNFHPISELMESKVETLREVERVGRVMWLLNNTKHNGFPVVNRDGKLRGMILRRHLVMLLKLKAFSQAVPLHPGEEKDTTKPVQLSPAATVFFETFERTYPEYSTIKEVKVSKLELTYWVDLRSYFDPNPFTVSSGTSVQRAYRLFRTMGIRHLVVLDNEHKVVGIVTRQDVTEHRLHDKWHHEGTQMQKNVNAEIIPPAEVYPYDDYGEQFDSHGRKINYFGDDYASSYADSSYAGSEIGTTTLTSFIIFYPAFIVLHVAFF